jgi:crotonobetainyl-CoA:carnitine CoA-transferase CaiB-like acyl-CoA transferase
VVQNANDLTRDPQLASRNTFWELPHRELGNYQHLGELFRLPQTPAMGEKPAPCLGEHTEYVCCELLNIPEDEFAELLLDGVFE